MADDERTQEQPEEKKPRRRRRKKADEEAAPQEEQSAATDASDADAGDEEAPEGTDGEAEGQSDEERPARAGRRGSAETTTASPTRRAPRRDVDGAVVVRARARYVRSAPRKARLVMDHIRGKPVEQARALLAHTPRAASADVLKLLNSAVANAESNHELAPDELRVRRAFVDEGPTIKRYRPRALGRATPIHKRTSHMTIELTTEETR